MELQLIGPNTGVTMTASLPTQGQQGVYIVDWLRGRFHFLSRLFHAFDLEYIYLDNSL